MLRIDYIMVKFLIFAFVGKMNLKCWQISGIVPIAGYRLGSKYPIAPNADG